MTDRLALMALVVVPGIVLLGWFSPRLLKRGWVVMVAVIGWGATVFTAEAGFQGFDTTDLGTFTPVKLLPPLAMVASAVALLVTRSRCAPIPVPVRWIGAYLMWLFVSAAFAEDVSLSTMRAIQAALPCVVVAIVVTRGLNARPFLGATILACYVHAAYAIVNPTFRGLTGASRLVGLLIPNAYAFACTTAVVALVITWLVGWWPRWLAPAALALAAVPIVGIVLTIGRTASVAVPAAVIAGLVVWTVRGEPAATARLGRRRVLLALFLLGVGIVVVWEFATVAGWFSSGQIDVTTLTGRTELWGQLLDLAADSPIIGYGPGAMRFQYASLAHALGALVNLSQAHNSLMEALINGGLIGAGLWVAAMTSVGKSAVRIPRSDRPLAVAMFAVLIIYSLTLGNMAGFGIGWYLLVALVGYTAPLASDRPAIDLQAAPPVEVDRAPVVASRGPVGSPAA